MSRYPNIEGGLLTETFTEQLPEGVSGLTTRTTLELDVIEQFNASTEHMRAVQFCIMGKNPDPEIDKVEPAYTLPGLDGSNDRMAGRADHEIDAVVCATTDVLGKIMDKFKMHGAVTSLRKLLVTTTAALDETTLQPKATRSQVDAVQIPTTKCDPKTVMVEPKYGGLGHMGKPELIRGSTT